jgi:UDP-GlcNAc:undecaprenyl-phosphate/decaprenyl-phosphate GlcNAc-1-phosphate transferase
MNMLLPLISFALCLAFTPLVRHLAHRRGWMAIPSAERWHKRPTALMGGIAIYAAAGGVLFFTTNLSPLLTQITTPTGHHETLPIGPILWVGMSLCFLLGLLDDFIHIKPHTKLVGQILIASVAAFVGFRLNWCTSMTLDTTLTIVWIVGITNAFNLIDNMDGLCAGIGFIAASAVIYMFLPVAPEVAVYAAVLAGALLAFLFYNSTPASIFMGDSGSLMIGYSLAILTLYFAEAVPGNRVGAYAVPVLVLLVPVLDTTLVTLIRLLSGRKAFVGGKDHTSHRLVLMGLTEGGAVRFLYLTGIVSGLSAIFVSTNDSLTSPVVIIPITIAIILMGVYLGQIRVYPEKEFSLLRGRPYTPILLELTYKKQLLMVVLDFFLIAFSYYLSYRLRYSQHVFSLYFKVFLLSLPAIISCKLLMFFIIGVYRGIWGYMSANDVYVHLKASTLSSLLAMVIVTFIYQFEGVSQGVFVIDWLITTGLLLGTRGSFRIFLDVMKRKTLTGKTVFIYGAGRGGEFLLRELLNNQSLAFKPAGFIDDDVLKIGKKLQGYSIVGRFDDLAKLAKTHHADGLLISFNHLGEEKRQQISAACKANGLFIKQFAIDLSDFDTK